MIYGDFEIGKEKLSSFIGYHGNDDDSQAVRSNGIDIKVKNILLFVLQS